MRSKKYLGVWFFTDTSHMVRSVSVEFVLDLFHFKILIFHSFVEQQVFLNFHSSSTWRVSGHKYTSFYISSGCYNVWSRGTAYHTLLGGLFLRRLQSGYRFYRPAISPNNSKPNSIKKNIATRVASNVGLCHTQIRLPWYSNRRSERVSTLLYYELY